jgi:hypothetical protein
MRRKRRAAGRAFLVATLTATLAALTWALAQAGPQVGWSTTPWPAAGLPGWPVALLL